MLPMPVAGVRLGEDSPRNDELEGEKGDSNSLLGRTFSDAERETNRAKGTSQMQRPKYEAISVKVGKSGAEE